MPEPTESLHDSNAVEFELPVWVVVRADHLGTHGFPMAAVMYDLPNGGRVQAVFTDEHLIERFIAEDGTPGRVPYAIRDTATLRSLMELSLVTGITHVAIDAPAGLNPRGEQPRFILARDVFASCDS